MSLRMYGTISGWGRSAGAVIPALGSGRYSPGPNIVLPSWLQGSDPHCTLNVFWGQPGALATVSCFMQTPTPVDCDASAGHLRYIGEDNIIYTVLLFFNDKYFTAELEKRFCEGNRRHVLSI